MIFFRRSVVCFFFLLLAGCVAGPPQRPPVITPTNAPPSPPPATTLPPKPSGAEEARPLPPLVAPTSGGIAYYQTRQEQQLRERILGGGIRIARSGDTIQLLLPGNAAFALNGDQLQPRFADLLAAIALVVKEYSKTTIEIKGYTDSTGSFEHNQDLSARRAQAAANFLIGKQVSATRIHTAGYGPRYPVADNKTDAGRAQNRRVEIDLVPMP